MSVSASILDAMVKAGATAEMIVAVVRAAEQEDAARLAEKRAKDAERKRRSRAKGDSLSAMSRGHDVTLRDGRGHCVTDADIADPLPEEKRKVSPCTPSKEKTQPLPISPGSSDEDPPPHGISAAEIADAVGAWNRLADEAGLPKVRMLTEARRQAVRRRLVEAGGIEGWETAMDQIRRSGFLRGENDRGWRADFDFVLQAKSFARLIEGAYADQPGAKARASPQTSLMDTVDRICGVNRAAPRDMGPVIEMEAER